jgi:hypothetical protein
MEALPICWRASPEILKNDETDAALRYRKSVRNARPRSTSLATCKLQVCSVLEIFDGGFAGMPAGNQNKKWKRFNSTAG